MNTREEVAGLRFLLAAQSVLLGASLALCIWLLGERSAAMAAEPIPTAAIVETAEKETEQTQVSTQQLEEDLTREELAVQTFARENGIYLEQYPESILALLERNPETMDFVLHYPLEYGKTPDVDLSAYENSGSVPLFLQWDRQWGYMDYGNDVAALTACGPVCLSMAAYYLTEDAQMSPDNVIRFAIDNGYCAPGDGSYWSLMDQGAAELGLEGVMVEPREQTVVENLEAGWPIVCVVGPGDFTSSGHFILLAGLEDGLIRINDPNSMENSQRLWKYEEIEDQILGMWVMRYYK